MSAYIIADVDVTDPQQYEAYKRWSSAAIQAHGAEVLVRGGAVTVLEGGWQPSRIVVLRFPSVGGGARLPRLARVPPRARRAPAPP